MPRTNGSKSAIGASSGIWDLSGAKAADAVPINALATNVQLLGEQRKAEASSGSATGTRIVEGACCRGSRGSGSRGTSDGSACECGRRAVRIGYHASGGGGHHTAKANSRTALASECLEV